MRQSIGGNHTSKAHPRYVEKDGCDHRLLAELGVDGFRVDMAHMVPPEFWKWMIHRAKDRNSNVFFCAEAYNDDPAKVLIAIPRSVRTTA